MISTRRWLVVLGTLAVLASVQPHAPAASAADNGEGGLTAQAENTLRQALAAMATRQWSGGWGMAWTRHGTISWGEFIPKAHDWVCVQPPATPTIAKVYLEAGQVLDDSGYIHHARMARDALVAVQTPEGGLPHEWARTGPRPFEATYDDRVTTGALDFLVKWWQQTEAPEDRAVVDRIGDFILTSQYDNGGWPQRYPPGGGYGKHITFNDGVMPNVIQALLDLHAVTGDERYLDAAKRGGDCIIALQGGPGEAIWAQQHDADTLEPAWARKFEPPGYTPAESVGACNILIELYLETGEARFLEPLPNAFEWYDTHRLENGKYARLYEPGTQRPVYGRRDKKKKVYDFEKACGGYGWQGNWYPEQAKRLYEQIQSEGRDAVLAERNAPKPPPDPAAMEDRVRAVCEALSPDGWWLSEPGESDLAHYEKADVSPDTPMVQARDFVRNARVLIEYLEAL
ncbi:MAG: pectate lyase [Candidatus Hydrogenedentota bacterium]